MINMFYPGYDTFSKAFQIFCNTYIIYVEIDSGWRLRSLLTSLPLSLDGDKCEEKCILGLNIWLYKYRTKISTLRY